MASMPNFPTKHSATSFVTYLQGDYTIKSVDRADDGYFYNLTCCHHKTGSIRVPAADVDNDTPGQYMRLYRFFYARCSCEHLTATDK